MVVHVVAHVIVHACNPSIWGQRQKDPGKFEANLVYMVIHIRALFREKKNLGLLTHTILLLLFCFDVLKRSLTLT